MNDLIFSGNAPAITSAEIAALVGSRHDNVKTSIERLANQGVIAFPASQEKATGGRPTVEYVFSGEGGKRDSIVVVAQLCPEVTARLVDRWRELEEAIRKPRDPATLTRMDLIKLAMEAEEERIALAGQVKVLAHEVEVMEPKAEFVDRFVVADGLYGLDNAARALNIPCRKFTKMLHNDGYLHYEGGAAVPYAKHRSKGWFEVRVTMIDDKPRQRTFITPAGLRYFANLIQQGELFPELSKPVQRPSAVAKALSEIAQIVGGPRPDLNGATP